MIGGIDLGGTKIEARVFDASFAEMGRCRIPTPTRDYGTLIEALVGQVRWLEAQGVSGAIGLASPGLVDPETGLLLAANLPASGQRFGPDLTAAVGRTIPLINDSRAATLSETLQGAARGYRLVAGLMIGTGLGGGVAVAGRLLPDHNGQHGEFGHLPIPADIALAYDLPLLPCGCGLNGCFETLLSGPGFVRLAEHVTGDALTEARLEDPALAQARAVWVDLVAALVAILARTIDPEVLVLGGGLGMTAGLTEEIAAALPSKLLVRTKPPALLQAVHGDASAALGAALFAQTIAAEGAR